MLNAEFKTKWIEALRSDKFKQGKGFLAIQTQEGDRFCCLGVACMIDDNFQDKILYA